MPIHVVATVLLVLTACSQREALEPVQLDHSEVPSATALPVLPPLGREREALPNDPGPKLDCGKPLAITELHIDPQRVPDRRGEFVEVYNPGPDPVNLNGWRLTDLGNDSHIIGKPGFVLEPTAFAVLGASADPEANGGVAVDYEYDDFNLSNTGDRVRIEDPCGGVAADLLYPLPRGWPKHRAGFSIERVDPPGRGRNRWRRARGRLVSGERASPGTARWHRKARGAATRRRAASRGARAGSDGG